MAPASTPLLMPQLAPSPFPFPLVSSNMFPMMPKEKTYRKGKWLKEEEDYALMLISHFKSGHLKDEPTSGVTLRAYLAEKLDCEPMRITKKFNGDASIGKVRHAVHSDDHDAPSPRHPHITTSRHSSTG
mmetsp:Transcript_93171/g.266239  ORF Transcript_93171/g.266239 Transcript_93171/m.266239 type:complete len:129 (-) Transcript_93171:1614-2000(-)